MHETRRLDIPMQTRLAPVGSVDSKTRTAELVWSRGTRVQRYDFWNDEPYFEELSMDPAHVRLGRLQNGAPLLDTHGRWRLSDVIGVVESAKVDGGEGRATVRFSEREEVQPIFQDVAAGIIRNVSVGYVVHKYEKSRTPEGVMVLRAVDWEPSEISLVPVGADAGAGVRSEQQSQQRTYPCEIHDPAVPATQRKETSVEKTQAELAAEAEAAKKKAEQERAEAVEKARKEAAEQAAQAERKRTKDIRDLVRSVKLGDEVADKLIDGGKSIEEAREAVLEELAKKTEQTAIRSGHQGIETISDETVNRREAAVEALLHRADPGRVKLTERARPFAGFTLRELMRKCLELRGVRTDGMSVSQMWERTFQSGSDLPNIVLDAANKSLRAAYEATPRSFVPWTRRATAPDFKNINRIQLSGAPSLLEVKSGGEYKRGAVSDGKETYQLATYGRIMGINRQTIINDDMNAFTRLPALAARAAADLESDTVYGVLTANAALSDSVALFHTTHSNTGTGVINVDNLGSGREKMRKQTGLEGRPINVRPQFLIVPAAKESLAEQYTSQAYVAAQASSINPFATGGRNPLTPIAEPRLDSSSSVIWYLAADPAQIDTIEYAYLEGQEGVYLESRMGWDIDGLELKVRLDFAAKALDHRGLYRSSGS
jgi:hypothetical protein